MFELLATSKYNKSFQNWMTSMFPTCQRIEIICGEHSFDNNILCATEHGKLQLHEMGNDFCQTFLILVTIFYDKIKYGKNDLYVYTVVDETFVVSPTLKKKFHELKVQVIHATKQMKQARRKRTKRSVSELT
jgi:hypothetical protein